jgi:hypothetical protein
MDRKRQLTLVIATVGIALGAGHLVQSGQGAPAVANAPKTTNVDFVSAGPAAPKPMLTTGSVATGTVFAELTPPEPVTPVRPAATVTVPTEAVTAPTPPKGDLVAPVIAQPVSADPQEPAIVPVPEAAPTTVQADDADAAVPQSEAPITPIAPVTTTPAPATEIASAACPVTMKIAAAPQAMIGISIVAPCAKDARVVIEHAGLAITGQTDDAGSLFLSLPALAVDATITAYVDDADAITESLRIPGMMTLRRFGVQWQNKDAFQLHAFENGANYEDPGHISASDPHTPLTGAPPAGGYVTLLGDNGVVLPMQAEIYTFPAGGTAAADVLVEAAVTEATCGRTLQGETIMTLAGKASATELTLAMPDCDAVGDILVLKNLVTDLTIAAAN